MRIAAIPIGGRVIASSRIRLYALLEALMPSVTFAVIDPREPAAPDPAGFDMVYIQKAAWDPVLDYAYTATRLGKPVVYDIDDDFGCWPGMRERDLCALATVVTVDSKERSATVRRVTRAPVHVIPCMIDLADHPARCRPFVVRNRLQTLCTFGNRESIVRAVPYLRAARPPDLRTIVIGPPDVRGLVLGAQLRAFDLATFVGDLMGADLAVLCHGPDGVGSRKDNNRLVMAMSLGLPAITTATKAYIETLREAGLPELTCARCDDFGRLVDDLRPRARREEISARFRKFAWERYSPQRCARTFRAVIEGVF